MTKDSLVEIIKNKKLLYIDKLLQSQGLQEFIISSFKLERTIAYQILHFNQNFPSISQIDLLLLHQPL